MGQEMNQIHPGTDGAREMLQRQVPLFAHGDGGTGSGGGNSPISDTANSSSVSNASVTEPLVSQGLNGITWGEENPTGNVTGQKKAGGRFGDVFVEGEGSKYEVHHIPADSASPLNRMDGPAIKMDKADHRQTASCGNSREAREFRATQKELIDCGSFDAAVQMDLEDIEVKFGSKYDSAINEMLEYIEQLKTEGKIDG